jgi:hypothetical protein
VVSREHAHCQLPLIWIQTLLYDFSQHADEGRMRTNRGGAYHLHAEFTGKLLRLSIKVVKNFEMIRYKAQWCNHNILNTVCVQTAQVVQNIGLQPGLRGRPASALVNQLPI